MSASAHDVAPKQHFLLENNSEGMKWRKWGIYLVRARLAIWPEFQIDF